MGSWASHSRAVGEQWAHPGEQLCWQWVLLVVAACFAVFLLAGWHVGAVVLSDRLGFYQEHQTNVDFGADVSLGRVPGFAAFWLRCDVKLQCLGLKVVKVLCCKQGCSGVAEWQHWAVGGVGSRIPSCASCVPAVPLVPAPAFLWAGLMSNQTSK